MQNIKTKIIEIKDKILVSPKYKKIELFSKTHKVWASIIAVAIVFVCYFGYQKLFPASTTVQYTYGRVKVGDLSVTVAGSGQVATLSKVSIKPQTTGQTQTLGQIVSVKVRNGDTVKAGQVVAILDGKNALQTYNQARASVASAQANYNKVIKGMTDAEALSANNAVTSAQTSVNNLKQNILIKLKTTYTTAFNLIYLNTDSFFTNVTVNPEISINNVSFNNQGLVTNINNSRLQITSILNNWRDKIKTQSVSDDLVDSINKALSDLNIIRNYFDDMTTLLSVYSTSNDSSTQSTLSTARSTASAARNSVDSSISDLTSTIQSYNGNIFSLQQAKDSLTLKLKPASDDDLAVAKASLDNALSNLANAQTAYSARIITAPFDGQIGGLSAEVGQQVSSSDSLGTLITSEKVINVSLNEVDAAKVSAGNEVTISYDSLPGVNMTGKVSYIDPLGTVSSGVVSYAVQIRTDEQNDQVKTGMTASVNITTTKHEGTLIIPTSAITTTKGKKYVLVADIASSSIQSFRNFNGASSTRNFASSSRRDFASSTRSSSSKMYGNGQTGTDTSSATTAAPIQYPVTNVEITVGISNGVNTEVLSGLSAGELIVTKKTTMSTATATKTSAASATTNTRGGGFGGLGGGAVGEATFIRGN